ncbi:MAG: hypothetical protein ACRD29_10595, partial [Acidimicrobiales bacterium]
PRAAESPAPREAAEAEVRRVRRTPPVAAAASPVEAAATPAAAASQVEADLRGGRHRSARPPPPSDRPGDDRS